MSKRICAFFQCTPNDLLFLDLEEKTPLTSLEVAQAEAIVKRAIARAEAMPLRRQKFGKVLKRV
ncbi:hypothetical protein CYANOKiyG1_75560 [Okeania sp. KiyG1]|nr:hypothetical protein CYANOKiyG1_75560 [Okeania sp. KiyG1]